MTWDLSPDLGLSISPEVVRVGCAGCDAYKGDISCEECLPILCLNKK